MTPLLVLVLLLGDCSDIEACARADSNPKAFKALPREGRGIASELDILQVLPQLWH